MRRRLLHPTPRTILRRLMFSQFQNRKYRKSRSKTNIIWNTYFVVYALKLVCEILKVPFEISHKSWNSYTAKYAFYVVFNVWRIVIS